jgi:Uncharacterized protein conserved in bacteria (DUF2213)
MSFAKITNNLVGARKRYETLNGKQYLVVPTVMITEGVHAGSNGPLLYQASELSKTPASSNHRPVVVYHPTLNGEGLSACDPGIVESQGVGLTFNAGWDGRVKGEVWLDEPKLKLVDNRVLEAINNGKMVEVSTGYFHDLEPYDGIANGKKYVGIVRNLQLDHLAILPDQIGACSIADGAGLLRNAADHGLSHRDIKEHLHEELSKKHGRHSAYITDVFPKHVVYDKDGESHRHEYGVKDGKATLKGDPEKVRKQTTYVTSNGLIFVSNDGDQQGPIKAVSKQSVGSLSEPMKHQQVQKALEKKYSGVQQEGDWGGWVTDVYANYALYYKDGNHFKLPYTYDNETFSFGEPEQVERISQYRPKEVPIDGTQSPVPYDVGQKMAGKPTGNAIHQGVDGLTATDGSHKSDGQQRSDAGGARKDMVNKMISGGHAKEEDRTFLEGLPDDHFEKVSKYVLKGATQPIVPYSYEGIGDRSNAHSPSGGSSHNQQMTANQYISQAPPEIREVLQEGVNAHMAEKQRLIKVITSNQNNVFTPEWLATQPMPSLRGLAALAGGQQARQQTTANYGGQAEVPMFLSNTQLGNNQQVVDDPVLALPIMDFSK